MTSVSADRFDLSACVCVCVCVYACSIIYGYLFQNSFFYISRLFKYHYNQFGTYIFLPVICNEFESKSCPEPKIYAHAHNFLQPHPFYGLQFKYVASGPGMRLERVL